MNIISELSDILREMFLVDLSERSIDAGHQLVQGRRENHLFRLSVTEQQLLLDFRKELILIEQDQAEKRLGDGIDISETTRGVSSVGFRRVVWFLLAFGEDNAIEQVHQDLPEEIAVFVNVGHDAGWCGVLSHGSKDVGEKRVEKNTARRLNGRFGREKTLADRFENVAEQRRSKVR